MCRVSWNPESEVTQEIICSGTYFGQMGKLRPGDGWGLHRPHKPESGRASALSVRLSLPPGPGHMRAGLCQETDVMR